MVQGTVRSRNRTPLGVRCGTALGGTADGFCGSRTHLPSAAAGPLLRVHPGKESTHSREDRLTGAHSSLICNSPEPERPRMSTSR